MKKTNIVLEDMSYGIYDRPGPSGKIADNENEEFTTVPDDVPISPGQHMSNQLTVQRPPIEDEDYAPTSIEELSRAASAISQLVPNSAINYFYKQLHRILDDATDFANKQNIEMEEDDLEAENHLTVTEESIRKELRAMLLEATYDSDERPLYGYDEEEEGLSIRDSSDDTFDLENEIIQDLSSENDTESSTGSGYSLDQIAARFGYSGPPGVRQEINKLTNRLEYFATKVKKDDLDALVKYGVGEYIDVMEETNFLDTEDIEDLRKSPGLVKDLDSFKFFFVSALVLPSYRKVVRDATKKVKQEIENLGIPKELHQTVFNQVTGAAARKPEVIVKKLAALSKSGKINQEEAKEIAKKITSARANLAKVAIDYSDDFVEAALERWSSTGKKTRQKILMQAMESTLQEV